MSDTETEFEPIALADYEGEGFSVLYEAEENGMVPMIPPEGSEYADKGSEWVYLRSVQRGFPAWIV